MALTALYLLITIGWGFLCFKYRSDLLPIQVRSLLVSLNVGRVELNIIFSASLSSELRLWNSHLHLR